MDTDKNDEISLKDPYKVIKQFYLENNENLSNQSIENHFKTLCLNPDFYESIPFIQTLTDSDLNHDRLVRIRCMIQDIFDPQFYPSTHRVINKATNKSVINEEIDSEFESDTFDRLVLFVIPIPCENKWTKSDIHQTTKNNQPTSNTKKRSLNNDDEENNNNNNSKNEKSFKNSTIDEKQQNNKENNVNNNNNNSNSNNNNNNIKKKKNYNLEKIYNFPVPMSNYQPNQTPFIVKVYDCDDSIFKLNQIVEFVGIIPKFQPTDINTDSDNLPSTLYDFFEHINFEDDPNIPDTLVPKFHAITYKHIDPYLHPSQTKFPFLINDQQQQQQPIDKSEIKKTRTELLQYLTDSIGDPLVSEYFLYYLLSKTTSHTAGMCLGNFSINISIPNRENAKKLPSIIEKLLSILVLRSYKYALSIDGLNDDDFVPVKDYDSNRIISGLLQLPQNTHLLIDETTLSEGKIERRGLNNLDSLKSISLLQKIEYEFQYHQIEMKTDIQLIDISFGKALVSCFCQVLLDSNVELKMPNDNDVQLLDCFTKYICLLQNLPLGKSSEEDSNFIQDDFVQSRQDNPELPKEILHYWLTLGKLVAYSFGEDSISIDIYKYMKQLDNTKNSRNSNIK
eukprot:gene5287-6581_t